jgi:hypothetical protein
VELADAKLKKMLAQAQPLVLWFNSDERAKLLPALQAMHELTAQPGRREPIPDQPNCEEGYIMLGLTPELVRQWKRGTGAEQDLRILLGEKPTKKVQSQADRNAHAVKHLEELVRAVHDGDDDKAERLTAAFADYYGF